VVRIFRLALSLRVKPESLKPTKLAVFSSVHFAA
jgi:hypothetical protein